MFFCDTRKTIFQIALRNTWGYAAIGNAVIRWHKKRFTASGFLAIRERFQTEEVLQVVKIFIRSDECGA